MGKILTFSLQNMMHGLEEQPLRVCLLFFSLGGKSNRSISVAAVFCLKAVCG